MQYRELRALVRIIKAGLPCKTKVLPPPSTSRQFSSFVLVVCAPKLSAWMLAHIPSATTLLRNSKPHIALITRTDSFQPTAHTTTEPSSILHNRNIICCLCV